MFVDGVAQPVGTRAFEILELLIGAAGELVTKDQIMRAVWPKTIVVENNIQVHISTLRKLLGGKRGWIRTEAGRGYRLAPPADGPARATQVDAAAAPVPVRASAAQRTWPLIGREREAAELRSLVERELLVTLVGPGGVGKSHLALEVATAWACSRGVEACHVDLACVSGHGSLVATLLGALRGAKEPGAGDMGDVLREIGASEAVLVFDNGERCVDALAAVCETIAASNTGVSMIVTSREPLRVACERIYRVGPLAVPDAQAGGGDIEASSAVRMFVARARAMGTEFPADPKTLQAIANVCRRLDGLPLALELAAARAASLGVKGLVADLERSLLSLSGGLRTAPPRHRTLRASIEWSYVLLDEAERIVLRRLAAFPGIFTLEAACALATCDQLSRDAVLDCVVNLASKSLLVVHSAGLSKCYSLLESVRAYAFDKLEEAGEYVPFGERYAVSAEMDKPVRLAPRAASIAAATPVPASAAYV
ncbi:transcriptional regulator [Paraburkholderia pallida]|uniref:Transcriptional regulator n=1 Tax=Paraburkholderia pallida TaxID=2547399 RepID=A0A4P7D6F5_9BURK|nr:transcriptional regulator [Paraburkholderia pallida]